MTGVGSRTMLTRSTPCRRDGANWQAQGACCACACSGHATASARPAVNADVSFDHHVGELLEMHRHR